MCWLRSPIALGGPTGALGGATLAAGFFATAFFAAGLRAGALFFEADFLDAFLRAAIRCTSFIRGVRCLAGSKHDAWGEREQGCPIDPSPTGTISFFRRPMHETNGGGTRESYPETTGRGAGAGPRFRRLLHDRPRWKEKCHPDRRSRGARYRGEDGRPDSRREEVLHRSRG